MTLSEVLAMRGGELVWGQLVAHVFHWSRVHTRQLFTAHSMLFFEYDALAKSGGTDVLALFDTKTIL